MGGNHPRKGCHGKPKKSRHDADLSHDHDDRLRGGLGDVRFLQSAAGIKLHHTGGIGNGLHTGKSQDDPDKGVPVVHDAAMERLHMRHGFTEVRKSKEGQQNHHDGGRYGDQHRKSTRMLRPEKIQRPDHENRCAGKILGMGHSEIEKCGEGADGRRDDIVGNQQKGSDNGDDLGAVTHAGIDTPAIRIVAADGDVVQADQRRQQTHGPDEPRRAVSGHRKGETDDISLTGSPVTVEDRSRPLPIDIARAGGGAEFHHKCLEWDLAAGSMATTATRMGVAVFMLMRSVAVSVFRLVPATATGLFLADQDDLEGDLLKGQLIASAAEELHSTPGRFVSRPQLDTDWFFRKMGKGFLHLPVQNERDIGIELFLELIKLLFPMLPGARLKHRQHKDVLMRVMGKGIEHARAFDARVGRRAVGTC